MHVVQEAGDAGLELWGMYGVACAAAWAMWDAWLCGCGVWYEWMGWHVGYMLVQWEYDAELGGRDRTDDVDHPKEGEACWSQPDSSPINAAVSSESRKDLEMINEVSPWWESWTEHQAPKSLPARCKASALQANLANKKRPKRNAASSSGSSFTAYFSHVGCFPSPRNFSSSIGIF